MEECLENSVNSNRTRLYSQHFTYHVFWKTHFQEKNAMKMDLFICNRCFPENICVNKSVLTAIGNWLRKKKKNMVVKYFVK